MCRNAFTACGRKFSSDLLASKVCHIPFLLQVWLQIFVNLLTCRISFLCAFCVTLQSGSIRNVPFDIRVKFYRHCFFLSLWLLRLALLSILFNSRSLIQFRLPFHFPLSLIQFSWYFPRNFCHWLSCFKCQVTIFLTYWISFLFL